MELHFFALTVYIQTFNKIMKGNTENMKRIRNCIVSLILCGVALTLSSCSALSEFEQLGIKGWLELGAPLAGNITQTPFPTQAPSEIPTTTPTATQGMTLMPTPPKTNYLTSLPIINIPPSIQKLLEEMPHKNFGGIPIMLSYTGTPSAFAGVNSSAIAEALDYIEFRHGSGDTLFNQREREELEQLLSGEEYFADAVYIPIGDAIKYATLGYLAPINHDNLSIETEEVYYTEVCESNSPDEYTYFTLPSFSTPYENAIVIYCNTDLLARTVTSREEFFEYLENGKWDVDLMLKYMSLAKEKIGDEYIIADTKLSKELLIGTLTSCCSTDYTRAIAEHIGESFRYSHKDTAIENFFQGNTLFYIGETADVRYFSKSADSYAIVPLPCEDRYQEKYPVMYNPQEVYVLAVPKSAANGEQAMMIMDMVALSTRYQFRYDFIEAMYAAYIRQNTSIYYTSVSRFDGLVYVKPLMADNTEDKTED